MYRIVSAPMKVWRNIHGTIIRGAPIFNRIIRPTMYLSIVRQLMFKPPMYMKKVRSPGTKPHPILTSNNSSKTNPHLASRLIKSKDQNKITHSI